MNTTEYMNGKEQSREDSDKDCADARVALGLSYLNAIRAHHYTRLRLFFFFV